MQLLFAIQIICDACWRRHCAFVWGKHLENIKTNKPQWVYARRNKLTIGNRTWKFSIAINHHTVTQTIDMFLKFISFWWVFMYCTKIFKSLILLSQMYKMSKKLVIIIIK